MYTKYKLTEQINLMNITSDRQDHDPSTNFNDSMKMTEWSEEYMQNFIKDFEENKRRQVKKRVKKSQ